MCSDEHPPQAAVVFDDRGYDDGLPRAAVAALGLSPRRVADLRQARRVFTTHLPAPAVEESGGKGSVP